MELARLRAELARVKMGRDILKKRRRTLRGSQREACPELVEGCAWIERHKRHWPITLQCEVLSVSASGYFERRRRKDTDHPATSGKRLSDEAPPVHIKAAHAASKGESGENSVPVVCPSGKNGFGVSCSMHGIKARVKRKFVVTTDSKHNLPIAPNLLNRGLPAGCA